MNAQALVQLLLLLNQITAQVAEIINSVKDLGSADEEALRDLLTEQRIKNDALYATVMQRLQAKTR